MFSHGLGLDAKANQNKETEAMLTSMKLIKKITTHYYCMIIQAFILTLVMIKAWDAKAKQNKEIKAMLISIMKLIKK